MRGNVRDLFRWGSGSLACDDVMAVLQHHLDHHLDDDMAELVQAHLDECRRCGLEADVYRRLMAVLAERRRAVPEQSAQRLREFARLLTGDPGTGLLG